MTTPLQFGIQGRNEFAPAFQELERRIGSAKEKNESWIKSLSHLTQASRNVFAGFKSMLSGIEALLAPSQKLVNLEVQLAASMARTGQLTQDSHKKLVAFAASRQDVTLFAREVTLRMASIGAEFGLTTDEIIRSITAVQDRAVALGRDPVELFRGLSKALVGIGSEWSELGLVVDATANRHEKLKQVLGQITPGMAELIAGLPTNALERLSLKIIDVADGLGRVIFSTRAFQAVVGWLDRFAVSLRDALGDPAKLAAMANAIDFVIQKIVQGFAYGASVIVRVAGTIVKAIEDIRETIMLALNQGAISALSDQIQALWAQVEHGSESTSALRDRISGLYAQMEVLSGSSSRLGYDLLKNADSMEAFSRQNTIYSGIAPTVIALVDKTVAALQRLGAAPSQPQALSADAQAAAAEDLRRKLKEAQDRALEEAERWGESTADVFARGFANALNGDTTARQAWKDMGKDLRDNLISQLTGAAFDPIKASFGVLAKALALPFEMVGKAINAILSPITNVIGEAINYAIEEITALFVVQETAAAASSTLMTALAAEIAIISGGWGAAAIAATIATQGAALASVPAAMEAISAGAVLTRAASIPAAAAGAFVEPRPGGTLVRVAEAGQAEVIAPMPKLEMAVGRAMQMYGGGGGGLSITLNGPMEFGGDRAADALANKLAGQIALISARDRTYRGGTY